MNLKTMSRFKLYLLSLSLVPPTRRCPGHRGWCGASWRPPHATTCSSQRSTSARRHSTWRWRGESPCEEGAWHSASGGTWSKTHGACKTENDHGVIITKLSFLQSAHVQYGSTPLILWFHLPPDFLVSLSASVCTQSDLNASVTLCV